MQKMGYFQEDILGRETHIVLVSRRFWSRGNKNWVQFKSTQPHEAPLRLLIGPAQDTINSLAQEKFKSRRHRPQMPVHARTCHQPLKDCMTELDCHEP